MRPAILLMCVLLTSASAGCADGFSLQFGGLNVGSLEAQILQDLEDDLDLELESVECPSGIQPMAGDVFVCRVYAVDDDSVGVVEVTQQDDQGNVSWELTDVLGPSGDSR